MSKLIQLVSLLGFVAIGNASVKITVTTDIALSCYAQTSEIGNWNGTAGGLVIWQSGVWILANDYGWADQYAYVVDMPSNYRWETDHSFHPTNVIVWNSIEELYPLPLPEGYPAIDAIWESRTVSVASDPNYTIPEIEIGLSPYMNCDVWVDWSPCSIPRVSFTQPADFGKWAWDGSINSSWVEPAAKPKHGRGRNK